MMEAMPVKIQTQRMERWQIYESHLLTLLLWGKMWILLRYFGVDLGYDVGGHLQHMTSMTWNNLHLTLGSFYYAHHPPVAFLLAKIVNIFAGDPLRSVQIISLTASLLAFFCIRHMLSILGVLKEPVAIAFLYITFALPLHVYLSMLIGIDPVIFLWACLVLLLSVRYFVVPQKGDSFLLPASIIAVLSIAMLTKYSGLLLVSIPFLVALTKYPFRWKQCAHAFLFGAMAIALVFPYYYQRYYLPSGTFFFDSAGKYAFVEEVKEARAIYRPNPGLFFSHLFIKQNDATPWLLPTWKGMWTLHDRSPQSALAERISHWYVLLMPLLIVLGGFLHIVRRRTLTIFRRLGFVLLIFTFLEIAALACYIYSFPLEGYFNNKSIYVAPASLLLGFLLAGCFELPTILSKRFQRWKNPLQHCMMIGLCVFVLINYALPVF